MFNLHLVTCSLGEASDRMRANGQKAAHLARCSVISTSVVTSPASTASRPAPTFSPSVTTTVIVAIVTADLNGGLSVCRVLPPAAFCIRCRVSSLPTFVGGYVVHPVLMIRKQRFRDVANRPESHSHRVPEDLDLQTAQTFLLSPDTPASHDNVT